VWIVDHMLPWHTHNRASIPGGILVARTISRATVSQPWDENGEWKLCSMGIWTNE
jgi:hypothetical protein